MGGRGVGGRIFSYSCKVGIVGVKIHRLLTMGWREGAIYNKDGMYPKSLVNMGDINNGGGGIYTEYLDICQCIS